MFINFNYIYQKIYGLFSEGVFSIKFLDSTAFIYLKLFLIFANIILAVGVLYITLKILKIRNEELKDLIDHTIQPGLEEPGKAEGETWKKIVSLADSTNSSDWKLAILEADKELDRMLSVIGYRGESLGDKLMSVEVGDFLSLDDAWEAHKVRNKIAHQADFDLPQREVKRIIGLYEKVFREFKYI